MTPITQRIWTKRHAHWVCAAAALLVLVALAASAVRNGHRSKDNGEPATHEGHGKGAMAPGKEDANEERHDEVTLAPEAIRANGIRIAPARRHILTPALVAPARVSFNTEQMAHVGSAVAGRVSELRVRLGSVVTKGDVLLVVDSPELGEAQSDYLVKRTAVATAEPAVELAKSAYERAKRLLDESQGIAFSEVQKRQAEYKAAQGALLSAKVARTAAENKLHLLGMDQEAVEELAKTEEVNPKYDVRGPIAGQVVEREATLGELVRPDREALLVLADMSTLWIMADVPEAKLDQVTIGSIARIRVASSDTIPIEGVVSYIAPLVDPATRTAKVRIEVTNGHTPLKPGMFAEVEISAPAGKWQDADLAVPDGAIQTLQGASVVFVVVPDEENTFITRQVTIGDAVGGMVSILAGLDEGEHLVVSGSFILKAELAKATAGHEH